MEKRLTGAVKFQAVGVEAGMMIYSGAVLTLDCKRFVQRHLQSQIWRILSGCGFSHELQIKAP